MVQITLDVMIIFNQTKAMLDIYAMFKSGRFSSMLLRILKILGIVIAAIFLLFGIVIWIVFEKKNDWMLNRIQSYVNESQSGQLKIVAVDLKLLRNFPNVTVELDGINYYEHRDSLRTSGEIPILHADKLFLAFELMPLLNDELKVAVISLSKAQLNIIEYQNGKLNINLALAKPTKTKLPAADKTVATNPSASAPVKVVKKLPIASSPKPAIQVDLNLVYLSDIRVTWNSYSNPKPYVVLIKELEADLFKDGKLLAARLSNSSHIQSFYIKDSPLSNEDLTFDASLKYDLENHQLMLEECELKYDVFNVAIHGTYAQLKNRMLDLQIDASSKDLEFLSFIVKPEVIKKNPGLLKEGNFFIKGRVFGELKNKPPQVDITFGMKNLSLSLPNNTGTFRDVGFEGKFSSGTLADYSEARLEIKNLRGQLPGGFIKGQFTVKNFVNPWVNYKLDARLKLDGYDQIFRLDFLKNLTGTISAHANFDGLFKLIVTHRMDKRRSSLITLDNLSFVLTKTNQMVSGLSGKIETASNQTTLHQLAFKYGKDDLHINATIDNLVYFLFYKESDIVVSGNLRSDEIYTKDFIPDTLKKADVQDRISNLSFDFRIATSAKNIDDTSATKANTFDIKNLSASFDKLPDIKMLNAAGRFGRTAGGLKLDLDDFHATMPYGNINVSGDMLVPKDRFVQFNARVKLNKFPWEYVKELVAEIKPGKEPSLKNLPVKEMEIITADLDLSAELITYPFDINKLYVRNSRVNIYFPNSKTISTEKLNVTLENLYFNHPSNSGSLTGVKSMKGKIALNQLMIPGLNAFDIDMNVTGADDRLNIAFSRVVKVTKSESGHLFLDISKEEPDYSLNYSVTEADLEYFIKKFYKRKFMSGKINYVLDLSASGSNWEKAKQNLAGSIEIKGDSLQLYGIDVDELLTKFKKSQNFNLTDLGAVIVAGPVGLAITKGSDFVSLARVNFDSTHQTRIHTLYSKWKLENRQLITQDVAVTTGLNRIAFDGSIDFARDSIPGLTVAVVDKNGCSLMDQKLYGKMGALQTGKLNVTKTIFGSVINSVDAVVGKDCKPVYTGKVKNPSH